MEGQVKFYNRKKGFGFITGDDGNDYFVHFTALPQGVFLRDGDKVSFEGAEGDKGLKASNVQLLQKASEMGSEKPASKQAEKPAEEESSEDDVGEEEDASAEEDADDTDEDEESEK